ncbi:methyltransferase [Carboxydochorda subterranea]|uniref:Methyltransferase n=1 Tax=Carboxydichorda subterranea TaxID=3109565 RepID=A0ABZ1BUC6_9FIRM|nr:methyltransferase [Limnochorda sp. L945t]WRP16420.1 methyltransferase [Limnochorda sp. L945t]
MTEPPGGCGGRGEHYFTRRPQAPHEIREVPFSAGQARLWLKTDRAVFSFRRVDPGTRLLAEAFDPQGAATVVDVGAGYGALGLMIKARYPQLQVLMVEINERAAGLARRNALRNGLEVPVLIGDGLSALGGASAGAVVTNPPVRAGRHVIYTWMRQASQGVLVPGGSFWVVIRTRQGAESLARALEQWVGPVETVERGSGYRVLRARRPA